MGLAPLAAASRLLLQGLRPRTPGSLRVATLPTLTRQVKVATLKDPSGARPQPRADCGPRSAIDLQAAAGKPVPVGTTPEQAVTITALTTAALTSAREGREIAVAQG